MLVSCKNKHPRSEQKLRSEYYELHIRYPVTSYSYPFHNCPGSKSQFDEYYTICF